MLTAILLAFAPTATQPNITVTVNAEGDLVIIGDAGDNNFSIDDEGGYRRIRVGNGDSLNGIPGPTEIPIAPVRGRLLVSLGDGDDTLWLALRFREQVIHLGNGDDFLDIGFGGGERVDINAGAGNDHVHTEDSSYGELVVVLGLGDDDFEVAFSEAATLAAFGCGGADEMRLRWTFFYGPVNLLGGRGDDTYADIDSSFFFGPPKVYGF